MRDVASSAASSRTSCTTNFKESIIQAFADGFAHKPDTTFGTVNADVLAEKLPGFERPNFCAIIRGSKHST